MVHTLLSICCLVPGDIVDDGSLVRWLRRILIFDAASKIYDGFQGIHPEIANASVIS